MFSQNILSSLFSLPFSVFFITPTFFHSSFFPPSLYHFPKFKSLFSLCLLIAFSLFIPFFFFYLWHFYAFFFLLSVYNSLFLSIVFFLFFLSLTFSLDILRSALLTFLLFLSLSLFYPPTLFPLLFVFLQRAHSSFIFLSLSLIFPQSPFFTLFIYLHISFSLYILLFLSLSLTFSSITLHFFPLCLCFSQLFLFLALLFLSLYQWHFYSSLYCLSRHNYPAFSLSFPRSLFIFDVFPGYLPIGLLYSCLSFWNFNSFSLSLFSCPQLSLLIFSFFL